MKGIVYKQIIWFTFDPGPGTPFFIFKRENGRVLDLDRKLNRNYFYLIPPYYVIVGEIEAGPQ